MKALSIQLPWAYCIFLGKDVENRDWRAAPSYRGPLLIHAGKKIDPNYVIKKTMWWPRQLTERAVVPVELLTLGAILGIAELTHVGPACHASPWAEDEMVHLNLANATEFKAPIPYKGALGLFNVPDEVVAASIKEINWRSTL